MQQAQPIADLTGEAAAAVAAAAFWPQCSCCPQSIPVLQVQEAGGELLPQVRADLQCQGLPWGRDIWRLQHTSGGA